MDNICFEAVGKAYNGVPVLQNFNACIEAGERVAVTGPSGVGKTTMARLLLGLEKPDAGRIECGGARFACAFQEDRLCEGFTAVQNVGLVLPRGHGANIEEALAQVGLEKGEWHKPVGQLSGGQRSRVALVRALLAPADVVVLDEAFKGLDEASRHLAYAFVENQAGGRVLLLVTHDMQEAKTLCNRFIVMQKA